ncbi:MAG TPA: hypothetical protein VNW46_15420 [Gemmatimonadaceae bacterium]|jgi:hypothetical protein|nr:hypothetical protein [Gemmatimonadaceae bacterium]
MPSKRLHSCLPLAVVAAITVVVTPRLARAQARFEWPDTAFVLAKYTGVDMCVGAVQRTWAAVSRRGVSMVWRDTMPYNPREAFDPPPAPVVAVARQCASRYPVKTVDLRDFAPLLRLYLDAGLDSDAATLVTRRVESVPPSQARDRMAVLDTVVHRYVKARPARLDAAEAILVDRGRHSTDRLARLEMYWWLLEESWHKGDTARQRRVARWMVSLGDSLTPAERQSDGFERLGDSHDLSESNIGATPFGGKAVLFQAAELLSGDGARLDSLRHSTAAFVALERSDWARATGAPEGNEFPAGHPATPVLADFWFPSSAASPARPARGRVSLMVFLSGDDCVGNRSRDLASEDGTCVRLLKMMRRLIARHPGLETTVITHTSGMFMYLPPPTPEAEADLLRQWMARWADPRTVLAVKTTAFSRVPSPDARRLDAEDPNIAHYSFGRLWHTPSLVLVDQDGTIMSTGGLEETQLDAYIDILMHRDNAGGTRASVP